MPRKINKAKIQKAIKATADWIRQAEAKGVKETFEMGNDVGFSVLWCEKRNLSAYKEMLELTYCAELGELKELYQAI